MLQAMHPPIKTVLQDKQQPPQPFEIALIRKIESKTTSVRGAFLLLDDDGDGRISHADVRTVLHNELGLCITEEQEDCMFSRSQRNTENRNAKDGMGYVDFAKYFQAVSSATYPASQSGLAAAAGFHRTASDAREIPIHVPPQTILRQRRHQLGQLLMTHSSRSTGSGMKGTSLFLAMDVHRSGKVTMQEFLDWLNSVGLGWTMEDLKQVVLGDIDHNGSIVFQKDRLAKRWFRSAENGGGETGMRVQEFAEFIESLEDEHQGK